MKLFAVAFFGFAIGVAGALHFETRQIKELMCQHTAGLRATERFHALVSVSVLDKLDENHIDKAKSLLATQVATYYNSIQELDASPKKQELLHHIETSSNSSPELKDALSKKP